MVKRSYGQHCGMAHAVDILGERWALLIIRDLLVGPQRFTDLRRGLAKIPSNVLTTRLKELEEAGVVERTILPRPATAVVYELTSYGQQLEEIVLAMGRWGAQTLGEPGPDDVVTPNSLTMAMRTAFDPAAAKGVHASFEMHAGDIVLHMVIDDGRLESAPGPLPEADLVIETGPAIRRLMAGEVTPAQAIKQGIVSVKGKRELLDTFANVFRIGPQAA